MIEKNTINIRMLVLCGLFSALIVVGAMIKVPLPGIPFTLQTLFVILAGLLLGSRGGLIAVLVYIFLGLAGLPVFSGGGGLMYVLKPSFGYIVGFALGAFVTGWLAEKNTENGTVPMVIAALAGTAVIYALGLTWY
nr:biotin transporter BioY [Acetobacterium sp.]